MPYLRRSATAKDYLYATWFWLLLAVLLSGWMLWSSRDLTPISQADAHPVEATFQSAAMRYTSSRKGRIRKNGFRLEFEDHEALRIPYAWQTIDVAEELPKTSRSSRPVVLSGLQPGMVCEMLVDPREPTRVLSLTADGTVLLAFEDALAGMADRRREDIAFAVVFFVCGAGLSLWSLLRYDEMTHAPRNGRRGQRKAKKRTAKKRR